VFERKYRKTADNRKEEFMKCHKSIGWVIFDLVDS